MVENQWATFKIYIANMFCPIKCANNFEILYLNLFVTIPWG